ncbi:hypothetical protein RJT34_32443 [Clitoria ternatea]|uniref:Protein TIFY n=1 Tax=Clitoria ternatea TaxID=43366 RepID=A0AAN9EWZ4_CLITE
MAPVNFEVEGSWKKAYPVMEDSNGDAGCDNMEVHNYFADDGSLMLFSAATRAAPTSGQNAVVPGRTQFTIIYKGNMCVYNGIPAEKVREIMLIAATSAKSAEMKSGVPVTSLATTPATPQGNSNNLASSQSVSFHVEKSSICRLQGEFPLARRQSLQRFLEKRRKRLGSKGPYASSATKVADNNFGDNTPDFGPLNYQRRDFSSVLLPLEGN